MSIITKSALSITRVEAVLKKYGITSAIITGYGSPTDAVAFIGPEVEGYEQACILCDSAYPGASGEPIAFDAQGEPVDLAQIPALIESGFALCLA